MPPHENENGDQPPEARGDLTTRLHGRLMFFLRQHELNTRPNLEVVANQLLKALRSADSEWFDGAIAIDIVPMDIPELIGSQFELLLTYWAYGVDESATMGAMARLVDNVSSAIQRV